MNDRQIHVAFYGRNYVNEQWRAAFDEGALETMFAELSKELAPLGFTLGRVEDHNFSLDIRGYGDLLNSIRLRAPSQGIGNMCLGHIIGPSAHRNLAEDIRRGVNRVAFAPETIEPEGSDKIVCHNCGCGC